MNPLILQLLRALSVLACVGGYNLQPILSGHDINSVLFMAVTSCLLIVVFVPREYSWEAMLPCYLLCLSLSIAKAISGITNWQILIQTACFIITTSMVIYHGIRHRGTELKIA